MEMDHGYYQEYPYYEEQVDYSCGQGIMQNLQEKRHRLMMNLQSYPYQRNEIESQIRQVDREIQQCVDQYGPNITALPYGYPKGSGPNSYMSPADSAIASGATSGATTKAPSVVGEGDLENFEDEEQYPPPPSAGYGYPGYSEQMLRGTPNDHVVQGRPGRVHGTMFPEESMEVPSTQMMPNQQTNLQRMSQCTQILKATLSNLATYQGSTDMTNQALPSLANLLSIKMEESTILEASKLMLELSKKEPSCRAIMGSEIAVSSIIKLIACTPNADIQKVLSGTLHNVSNDRHGQVMIYNCNGIPCLVRLLSSQVNAVLFYAITTLHNMLLHFEPAKMEVRLAGGLEKMVQLLNKENPKFLAITADCLHLLAYGHQDSKLIILSANGPSSLVRILRLNTYEKLLWTCSRLLKVLSVCSSNKAEIVQAGGIQALANHLGHKSTRLVQNILFTIRNLSDAATTQDHLDDLLRQLIMLLSSNDVTIVTCSAGVLSNLTCNNAKNKTIVCQLHGVSALLKAINNSDGREEIIEASVSTLRHLTSRHPNAEAAQNAVRQQSGIPMLTNFLQQQCRWPLMKALLGLVRNLALSSENLPILRENLTVDRLWNIIVRANQDAYRRGHTGAPPGFIDGVYMEEILEIAVGCLHLMAKDINVRTQLRHLNSISTFVQLLNSNNESLTRVAAGTLCEISQDPEGATLIEHANASGPLTELLHSSNESVAAYSAAVLFCLSENSRKQQQVPVSVMQQQQQQPQQHQQQPLNLSHFNTGYSTPNDVSGFLSSDLDLPLDLGDLNEFPMDSFHGFPHGSNV